MLRLAYSPDVPAAMIEVLEHHARALGASLADVERLGQTLDGVEDFILACEAGRGADHLRGAGRVNPPAPARARAAA